MALQVVPDRFREVNANIAKQTKSGVGSNAQTKGNGNHIRRPTNGIQLKEPSFSTLRVVAGNGEPVILLDAGSRRTDSSGDQLVTEDGETGTDLYSNFLLQSIQYARTEKTQILETFGEAYIYLFGERPVIYTFQGTLLNTFDFNWEAEWESNYDTYIRGTRCVENDAQVFLAWDETIVSGYVLGMETQKNPEQPHTVVLSFQMFVTSNVNISALGDSSALPVYLKSREIKNLTDAAPFLPTPLLPGSSLSGPLDGAGTGLQMPSLIQGFLGSSIVKGASSVVGWVNNTLIKGMHDWTSGEVVRVPYGYAGTLIYDDKVAQYSLNQHGTVTYTDFQDNDAEYVGESSYYGSPTANGVLQFNFDPSADDLALSTYTTQQQALAVWAGEGLAPPASYQASLSGFLLNKVKSLAVPMIGLGASLAWKKASTPAPGAPANPAGAVTQDPPPNPKLQQLADTAAIYTLLVAAGAGRKGKTDAGA